MSSERTAAASAGERVRAWLIQLSAPLLGLLRVGPVPPRRWLKQARPDNCSQTVIAMLTGRSVSAISRSAGHTGALGVSQALRLLSALGLPLARPIAGRHAAEFWPVYRQRSGGRRLRGLAFRVSRPGEEYGHVCLLFGKFIYDPADGLFRRLDAAGVASFDWVALFPGE